MMMFEPSPSTCCSTSCLAPLPIATRITTAATPMTTPSMVSALRSRLARNASSATRNASPASHPARRPRRRAALVGLDQPVAHPDPAPRQRRDLEVVGDDDDGDAALGVEPLEDRHHLGAAGVSRLPVGSSASSSVGSPTRARAIATRCCSPPESWPGRWLEPVPEPDRLERRGRRARGARAPRTPR